MKKAFKFLFAAIIMVAFGTNVFAQTTVSPTVSTNVLAALTALTNTNVVYGGVLSGVQPNIDPVTGTKTNAGATATVGKVTISGTAAASVQITYTNPITIARTVGAGLPPTLTFAPSISRRPGVTGVDLFGGVLIGASPVTYAIDASGSDVLFVGGTLSDAGANIPASAIGNTYSGPFTITLQYN